MLVSEIILEALRSRCRANTFPSACSTWLEPLSGPACAHARKIPQVRISQGAPYFSDTYTDFPNLQPVNRTVTVVKIVGTHCTRSVPSSAVFVALYASKRENAFSIKAARPRFSGPYGVIALQR